MRAIERDTETHPEKDAGAATRWPGWEDRLIGAHWFDLIPSSLLQQLPCDTERILFPDRPDTNVWAPVLELKEAPGRMLVTVELPGILPEDIKVHALEDAIVLEGERRGEHDDRSEGFYHSERAYGRFCRSIPLPKGAEIGKASARLAMGVLEVTVPIPEPAPKSREIPIECAN